MQTTRLLLIVMLSTATSASAWAQDVTKTLPGTAVLSIDEPLDEVMVSGINRFALRALGESREQRAAQWLSVLGRADNPEQRLADLREKFRTIIGAVDERVDEPQVELISTPRRDSIAGRGPGYVIHAVRWRVLDGVTAEGLLLQPEGEIRARIVALPDADWTPEMFAGLAPGIEDSSHIPAQLAGSGMQVLVPTLISRDDTYSGHPEVRYTNQPHREFVYRMAFEMGRHVIGYEVQKVLAGVDVFERWNRQDGVDVPIGVCGVGEGGLLALYSAAIDPRVDAVHVAGYFQRREGVWEEPIYRNLWSLLTTFGDAEIAALIAPRSVTIEACAAPTIDGPPPQREGRSGAAPGRITVAEVGSVRDEFARAQDYFAKLGDPQQVRLIVSDNGDGPAGTSEALTAFASGLGVTDLQLNTESTPPKRAAEPDPTRQGRQVAELVEFTQRLLRRSSKVRDRFWSSADRSSVEAWQQSSQFYRDYVWEEMIGKLPPATMTPNVRSRLILEGDGYQGYEVVLDVFPDVIAGGILLLPDDVETDERRPVVVCQHGLEGTPMHTINGEGEDGYPAYKAFSAELAKRRFIVYAPQNPYRGRDEFRTIQRKSNPMQRSLFSYIIRQHEQTLEWLAGLPNVDAERIAFYGLSYGGKTAVRVPPMLDGYCLSICSADFDEWVLKNVSSEDRYSYIFTGEYEMFEWNMGHVANYAELASLMAPRPFMVERGHDDGVAPDEWVAWEYAKVRRHYDRLGIGEKTEIEFFNGPHTINGQGTFAFLHLHLDWPER